jgi:hypothetical protein
MNLIEELGLEKYQAIVHGAPDWATTYCTAYAAYGATFHWYGACKNCYELPALRTAIAEHDQHWYGHSEEKELEQYSLLQQEKIEGGAALVGDFTAIQEQLQTELNNCSKKDSSEISITDDCTDIRNHISPLTGVIER